jgi:hypothetical protein
VTAYDGARAQEIRYQQLEALAKEKYPKLANKWHNHHIVQSI